MVFQRNRIHNTSFNEIWRLRHPRRPLCRKARFDSLTLRRVGLRSQRPSAYRRARPPHHC